jgi:hypothetical protein
MSCDPCNGMENKVWRALPDRKQRVLAMDTTKRQRKQGHKTYDEESIDQM